MSGVLVPRPAQAQDITFQADVDSATVSLGGYIRLTLTATGVQSMEAIELPAIDGFQARYIGPSTRVSIVNGKYSSSYAFIYNLYPQKTGYFEIPAFETILEGKTYATQPIRVQVVAEGNSRDGTKVAESLQERLFVVLSVPKQEAFLNEQIPVVVRLYINDLSIRNVEYPVVSHDGFLMDDLNAPRQYSQILNGIRYTIIEFTTFVYPMKSGAVPLGPVTMSCNLIVKNTSAADRMGSFGLFDDDFLSGFFDSYTSRPVQLQSKPIAITVSPLPEEGKPKDFSGAVGKFAFNVTVSPDKVKVGDPVTVRMQVGGQGSLKTFELPAFETNDDFKAYDPQVKEQDGVKTLEQVLIPRHAGATTVPEIDFSFFDTEQQQYRTISWGPTTLDVQALSAQEESRVVGLADQKDARLVREDRIGRDISFIKERLGRVERAGDRATRKMVFQLLWIVLILGWTVGYAVFGFTHKMRTDEHFARRLKAPGYARKGLAAAKTFLEKNKPVEFYDTLFKTMQVYFGHKFHMAPGAVNLVEIRRVLEERHLSSEILQGAQHVFEECEAARYAALGFSQAQMTRTHEAAQRLIDGVERKC